MIRRALLGVCLVVLAGCGDDAHQAQPATADQSTRLPTLLVARFTSPPDCTGHCAPIVEFDGNELHLSSTAAVADPHGSAGTLTTAGVDALGAALDGVDVLALVGPCETCAELGSVNLNFDTGSAEASLEYPVGHPPPDLEALDEVIRSTFGGLVTCEANEVVEPKADCEPLPT